MNTDYTLTVGLEVHAELKTNTKMFCGCKNDPDEARPNRNVCPICMGHPGTLPTINKEAVKSVLKVGMALGSALADYTEFDRKHYFYPDIPKGYQLSQYAYPLVTGGALAGVEITRVHLEEDTARSTHEGEASLIDFNRSSLPLMELVTEPVIKSPEQAGNFARELQLILQYLRVAEANMEKGEMRVEANISVSKDPEKFGTKVEVKNLNSFKAVEKAIAYEMKRHIALLEAGEKVVQETRGWDENKQTTFSQRKKEDSHDYRYFPDPDLPKIRISKISEFSNNALRKEIPELPSEKRIRYSKDLALDINDIEFFVNNKILADFFEKIIEGNDKDFIKNTANYIISDFVALIKNSEKQHEVAPENFKELMNMNISGELSSRGTKDVLKKMFEQGGNPRDIAETENLMQKSNEEELVSIIKSIISANPGVVAEYKAGKQASLQFFIGQAMKASKGSANPQVLKKLLEGTLSSI